MYCWKEDSLKAVSLQFTIFLFVSFGKHHSRSDRLSKNQQQIRGTAKEGILKMLIHIVYTNYILLKKPTKQNK